jgi:large subunit ribosomal protein L21
MYAIVDIAGQQFKVEQGQEIFVHRLDGEKGSQMDFDKVLMIENEGKTILGAPVVEGAQVKGTILEHLKGDKVFVFKKKRRKGYQKLNGHRQYLSLLKIDSIEEKGAKAKKTSASKKVAAEQPETNPETQEA